MSPYTQVFVKIYFLFAERSFAKKNSWPVPKDWNVKKNAQSACVILSFTHDSSCSTLFSGCTVDYI